MKKQLLLFAEALLNSYAILFFSQNSVFAVLLLVASFFNPIAGSAGLACTCVALLLAKSLGFAKDKIQAGLYSFNPLLLGIGFGTFFHTNLAFGLWLAVACMLSLVATITITQRLGKAGLPALSLPFILIFWLMLLAANGYGQLGLEPKESYMLNELAVQPHQQAHMLFTALNTFPLPSAVTLFFRAMSATLFQDSVAAGMIISIGVLIHSRISFSLLIIGFITACSFNYVFHIYNEGLGHYHLGINFMVTTMAIGSFFFVPSWRSYVCAIISVPLSYILIGALTTLLEPYHLPVLSLPLCVLVIVVLYFFQLRSATGQLQITQFQNYSPETNLYLSLNGQERLTDLTYHKISLPFMGSWLVSQGYDGSITHLQDWGKALDFVIANDDRVTYHGSGTIPEHFFCFGKPILACTDGVVEAVVNYVDDNLIGQVNIEQNWGNVIVIKHADGLYSQVSHLKKYSVKVKPGDYVKQGELIALCGNSGRSPEPHLHFQLQSTPFIGSRTLAYPFAYYTTQSEGKVQLHNFEVPTQGTTVETPEINLSLKNAFSLQPGYIARITSSNLSDIWEVYTDTLNQTYIYSHETGAMAYFVNNGSAFYFTNYYGSHSSLLYKFFLAAYKVVFTTEDSIVVTDAYPLNLQGNSVSLWLHDFVAPFYRYLQRTYKSTVKQKYQSIQIQSNGYINYFGRHKEFMDARIDINHQSISTFSININNTQTQATWQAINTY